MYDNEAGIRDRMGLFWTRVAQRFAGNPYILGYELINEPWAGDIYGHPDQLEARECIHIDNHFSLSVLIIVIF